MDDSHKSQSLHEARRASMGSDEPGSAGEVKDFAGGCVKRRLTMVTAVWGDWHLDMHFNVNLPTLLAPAQSARALRSLRDYLPHLHACSRFCAYRSARPRPKRFAGLMSVEIKLLNDAELKDPIAAHHKVWNRATERPPRMAASSC